MTTKFELTDAQHKRVLAWSEKHWQTKHKTPPKEMTGAYLEFSFIPNGLGDAPRVRCIWCKDEPTLKLSIDDDGEFMYDDFGDDLPLHKNNGTWGIVSDYDATTGVATVILQDCSTAKMHAGAFISGLPARLPGVGDNIIVQVIDDKGLKRVTAARPWKESHGHK